MKLPIHYKSNSLGTTLVNDDVFSCWRKILIYH